MTRAPLHAIAAALLAAILACAAHAQDLAIRAAHVYTAQPGDDWLIEDGVVIIRNGRIAAVGPADSTPIPSDLPLIHDPYASLLPGLVAAASDLVPPHTDERSLGPAFSAADAFDRYADYRTLLASGITAAHIDPGPHRLIAGRGAVARLAGPPDARILRPDADCTIALTDAARNPPDRSFPLVPPSPDQDLKPDQPQPPASRIEQLRTLRDAIHAATSDPRDSHDLALARAWRDNLPLRIHADDPADISAALAFLRSADRPGYIVGAKGITPELARRCADAGVPVVFLLDLFSRAPAPDLRNDPDARDAALPDDLPHDLTLALALRPAASLHDLRLAVANAGLPLPRAIEACTRAPAHILGLDDRIGSIEPGKDADLILCSGHPLDTTSSVQRVLIQGRTVYLRAPDSPRPIVLSGATVWLGPDDWLTPGSILIKDGLVAAVGRRVPHPQNAISISLPPDAFITPGFIDALSHLALEGDDSPLGPDHSLAPLIATPDHASLRLARAGVTTVLSAPRRFPNQGARLTAFKTAGRDRSDRLISPNAALLLDLSSTDHADIPKALRDRFEPGRKYADKWKKYHDDLAAWEQARHQGTAPPPPPEPESVQQQQQIEDPISGIWQGTVQATPFGGPYTGRASLSLSGNRIEGRIIEPEVPTRHRILGTLDGNAISGSIEVDADVPELPLWNATIADNAMTGTIRVGSLLQVDFSATRVQAAPPRFRLHTRRRATTDADGRPLPPDIDESLEPIRAVIERRAPLLVRVASAPQAAAVIDALQPPDDVHLILIAPDDALPLAPRLAQRNAGVIVPTSPITSSSPPHRVPAIDWSNASLHFAFHSDAEDGARALPDIARLAVHLGLNPEHALAALTTWPAELFLLTGRVGSIAPGAAADLLIFSRYPFDPGARLNTVIVSGEILP